MTVDLTHDVTTGRDQATESDRLQPARQLWTNGDMVKAIVAVIIATLIASVVSAAAVQAILEPGQNPEDDAFAYTIALLPNMVAVELFMLAAVLWFVRRKYGLPLSTLGLRRPEHDTWLLPAGIALFGLAIVYGYDALLALTPIESARTPDEVFDSPGPLIVVIVGAVLLAPWIEEIFFRGFLFGGIDQRHSWVWAAIISSFVFALAHLDPFGIPAYLALGFLFAWAYHRTESLKASMIAHAAINTTTVGIGLAIALG
jgi:membrane protease YdiL (CAAX protease family)